MFLELILCTVLVFKNLKGAILLSHFLFVPGWLSWSLDSKRSTFDNKTYNDFLHKMVNLGFQNFKSIFLRMRFLWVVTFFPEVIIICLSWYLHLKHVSLDFETYHWHFKNGFNYLFSPGSFYLKSEIVEASHEV